MAKRMSLRTFAPSRLSATSSEQGEEHGPHELTEQELQDIVGQSTTTTEVAKEAAKAKAKERKATLPTEEESEATTLASARFDEDVTDSEQAIPGEHHEHHHHHEHGHEGVHHDHKHEVDESAEHEEGEGEDEGEHEEHGDNGEEEEEHEHKGFHPHKVEHVEKYYHKKSLEGKESLENLKKLFGEEEEEEEEEELEYGAPELHEGEGNWKEQELYPIDKSPSHNLKSYVTAFEALALSTFLEDLYLQLKVLGHSFPGQFLQPEEADFLTNDEKFAMEVSPAELVYMPKLKNFKNPFIIDETKIGTSEERQAHKMQKDRAFLQEIIRLVKDEMAEHRTFESLKDNVSREDGRRHEEITLVERGKKAKRNVTYLRRKIADFREQMARDEHNRKEMIVHLKDQLFQEKQNAKMDARYTRATLEARNTFNYSELNHLAELEQLKIKELEIQMTRDRLAHRNIEAWSALMFSEIEGKLNGWNFKFEGDLEDIDKKVREKQDILRAQQAKIAKLNETIEERMVELGPWEEEKEKERQEHLTNMRLFYSARRIQRWWRAFMVKHNLYKKRKGKKGGKGKKGTGASKIAKKGKRAKKKGKGK